MGAPLRGNDPRALAAYLQGVAEVKPRKFEVQWSPATVALDRAAAIRSLRSISRDGAVFGIASDETAVAQLKPGSILWSWNVAIRKVESLESHGNITLVHTRPVALNEAMPNARIEFETPIDAAAYYRAKRATPPTAAAALRRTRATDFLYATLTETSTRPARISRTSRLHATLSVGGQTTFSGDGGFDYSPSKAAYSMDFKGDEPSIDDYEGMSPGVSAVVLGVQMPRLGVGLGLIGTSTLSYVDVINVITMTNGRRRRRPGAALQARDLQCRGTRRYRDRDPAAAAGLVGQGQRCAGREEGNLQHQPRSTRSSGQDMRSQMMLEPAAPTLTVGGPMQV